ncbi:MAG: hypothetical protein HRU20_10050 [Pseudomonadales bacterium]|nr:hypothetical protein [Pseudomonadales bacterium]
MPERDTPLNMDKMPAMQADKRVESAADLDVNSAAGVTKDTIKTIKAPRSLSAIWPAVAILVLCIIGLSLWNNALVQESRKQQDDILDALQRISRLENSLSSTDESMTQSSVVMQIRLKKIEKDTKELTTQMDKLWASAWRRNQTEIAAHSSQINALGKAQKTQKLTLADLDTQFTQQQKNISQLKAENTSIAKNIKVFSAKEKELAKLKPQLLAQIKASKNLKQQVQENTQWQKSNNAFRQQTNKNFARLEKDIAEKHKPVSTQPAGTLQPAL